MQYNLWRLRYEHFFSRTDGEYNGATYAACFQIPHPENSLCTSDVVYLRSTCVSVTLHRAQSIPSAPITSRHPIAEGLASGSTLKVLAQRYSCRATSASASSSACTVTHSPRTSHQLRACRDRRKRQLPQRDGHLQNMMICTANSSPMIGCMHAVAPEHDHTLPERKRRRDTHSQNPSTRTAPG